jgi:hypothetical protein
MNDPDSAPPGNIRLTVWLIWFGLLGALAVYVVMLRTAAPPPPAKLDANMPRILGVVAVVVAIVSLVLRKVFLGGYKTGALNLESYGGRKLFITGHVVCFALSESIGVFGLMLGFVGYPLDLCAWFLLGAVAMMLWHMPLASRFSPSA